MVEVGPRPLHACQGIADARREWRFALDCGELYVQPDFQIVEDWSGLGTAELGATVWWRASGFLLDGRCQKESG